MITPSEGAPSRSADVGIGLFDDLRGGFDQWIAREAIDLAEEDVARAHGTRLRAEWVSVQVQGLPGWSLAAVERAWREVAESGVVGVIGPAIGDEAIALASLIEASQLPTILWSGSEVARGPFAFHYQFGSLEEDTAVLALHLKRAGISNVAVLWERTQVGTAYRDSFSTAALHHQISISAQESVAHDQEDISGELERLSAGAPKALVYLGLGLAAPVLSRALAARDWGIPVYLTSAGIWDHIQSRYAEYFDGWTYVDTSDEGNPVFQSIASRLWEPHEMPRPGGALFYDMAALMLDAVYRARDLSRLGVRDAMAATRQRSAASVAAGTMLSFGNWDRAALKGRYLVMRQWRNGRSELVEQS